MIKFSTLDFINELVYELTNIAPSNLIRTSGLSKGRLSYIWVSKNLFQKAGNYLSKIRQRIVNPNDEKYNPDFKFSLEDLNILMEKLKFFAREWQEANNKCKNIVESYISLNKGLKQTPHQQWDIYNPRLREDFFRDINKKGSYWLGFLCADGYLIQNKQVGITLMRKDKDQLVRFCCDIGLDPISKIKDFERERNDNIYELSRVTFGCRPIVNDLLELKFKEVPQFIKNLPNASTDSKALSWLYGLFDGDGQQGKTALYSTKKKLLDQIKTCFNVPNNILKAKNPKVRLDRMGEIKFGEDGEPLKTKTLYVLRLGPILFNRMMSATKETMPRKRNIFDEKIDATTKLKTIFNNKRELLQELVDHLPRTKITSILNNNFRISRTALYNIIDEWGINIPPAGYWNSEEGKLNLKTRKWFFGKIDFKT